MMKPGKQWSSIRILGTLMKLWTMWSTIARPGGSPRQMMKDRGTRKGKSWQPKKQRGGNASSANEKHTNIPIQQALTQIEADQAKQI